MQVHKKRYTPNLTRRDLDVINLLRFGMTNKQIADRLFIQEKSVKWHFTQIYKILGIHSQRELMALLINIKLAPSDVIVTYREDCQTKLAAVSTESHAPHAEAL